VVEQLKTYIRARFPLLYVLTWEEERAVREIERTCIDLRKKCFLWTQTQGLRNVALNGAPNDGLCDPMAVLNHVIDCSDDAVFAFLDFHPFLEHHPVHRRLRDLVRALKRSHKTLILLSPVLSIPEELKKDMTVLDFALPGREELGAVLDSVEAAMETGQSGTMNLNKKERDGLIRAAQGLTVSEMENVLALAVVQNRRIDKDTIPVILTEKRNIIRKSGILEYVSQDEGLEGIGGLENLKAWVRKRSRGFSDEARAFGLPVPKGLLLVGVQGCGKTLTAKAVSKFWRFPLLRLDMGAVFSGMVGASERNIRHAIQVAESIAPCLLWIDEIDKGFSGTGSSNYSDGGTAARVFGTFMTWLQEKNSAVFTIATANDISQLPPELMRKGRFDEIFFIDLPTAREREAIFRIHLRKRNRDPGDFEMEALADSSKGFSGAEIEQAIVSALYDAFEEDRPLTTPDIVRNLGQTVPLSRTVAETITALRQWAEKRARKASSDVELEFDDDQLPPVRR
jgi:SpoVK/Ycf46/Vps4 family AAA+-type ATPase